MRAESSQSIRMFSIRPKLARVAAALCVFVSLVGFISGFFLFFNASFTVRSFVCFSTRFDPKNVQFSHEYWLTGIIVIKLYHAPTHGRRIFSFVRLVYALHKFGKEIVCSNLELNSPFSFTVSIRFSELIAVCNRNIII